MVEGLCLTQGLAFRLSRVEECNDAVSAGNSSSDISETASKHIHEQARCD